MDEHTRLCCPVGEGLAERAHRWATAYGPGSSAKMRFQWALHYNRAHAEELDAVLPPLDPEGCMDCAELLAHPRMDEVSARTAAHVRRLHRMDMWLSGYLRHLYRVSCDTRAGAVSPDTSAAGS